MTEAAISLQRGGAECIVICSNTMHRMADEVSAAVDLPLLHIADATADCHSRPPVWGGWACWARASPWSRTFYRGRLVDRFGLDVIIPSAADRETVHRIIYEELVRGIINDASRAQYQAVIETLRTEGAEAIILGCTEIGLLINNEHSPIPLFDTTVLHALAAVDWALGQ